MDSSTYDTKNCPRMDGGFLTPMGDYSRGRYDPERKEPHWSCDVCGKFWTLIELIRL